jgi:soluble lytic murein transglycosylase
VVVTYPTKILQTPHAAPTVNTVRRTFGFRALSVGAIFVLAQTAPALAWDGLISESNELAATSAPAPDSVAARDDVGIASPSLAWRRAKDLLAADQHQAALDDLNIVGAAYPNLVDRVEVLRGHALLGLGDGKAATAAYELAIKSTFDTAVETEARVGLVRAKMVAGRPDAAAALSMLRARYPALPNGPVLELELAQMHERAGKLNLAVPAYRRIDLTYPGSPAALTARTKLEALVAAGNKVAPLSVAQRIERTERLVYSGPMSAAKAEIEAQLGTKLGPAERTKLVLLAARVARVEGRWSDVRALLLEARGGITDAEELARARRDTDAMSAREADWARKQISFQTRTQSWEKLQPFRLRAVVGIAANAGLAEETDRALTALLASKKALPDVLYDAALVATGVGNDGLLEVLFGRAAAAPKLQAAARYHQARALERMGRTDEAAILFEQVRPVDRTENQYYAMWAELRLAAIGARGPRECVSVEAERSQSRSGLLLASNDTRLPAGHTAVTGAEARDEMTRHEGTRRGGSAAAPRAAAPIDHGALAFRLSEIAERNNAGFPWFARARSLLLLGDASAASDELHEAFLAWRDANGRPIRRAGLEAVFRGEERIRRYATWNVKRARKSITLQDRRAVAEVASVLGDEGTAAGFGGWDRVTARPRAYEDLVRRAAAKHGLDPNLLFAVMRVESVYQKRIVSAAGAIGLMQIMPRTGWLIAQKLGHEHFTAADLLNPETNLDFAAWYLASLIDRFDGHLPLAIASYNGGPHNVRRWIHEHGDAMPLDAFLERIPFTETHRYVRRVLTHYAAYRAQEGTPMENLSLDLPKPKIDAVAF